MVEPAEIHQTLSSLYVPVASSGSFTRPSKNFSGLHVRMGSSKLPKKVKQANKTTNMPPVDIPEERNLPLPRW
jgi:hypothetical protein